MKAVFVHKGRENLGIEILSAYLKQKGHLTELVYDSGLFSINDNVFNIPFLEKLFAKDKFSMATDIIQSQPDIIAFSVFTNTYQWALSLAEEIKKRTDTPIVFGGIHPSFLPEIVLKNKDVDYVIKGEGEEALLELLENLHTDKSKIKNLSYKDNNKIIENELRPAIDLDSLPLPDKALFEKHIRLQDDYLTITSRGCIYNCSYCSEQKYKNMYTGKYNRKRSVDSVITELETMKKRYNFKEVMFFDSIFTDNEEWILEFAAKYKEKIDLPFRCMSHVKFINKNIADAMKTAGCYCIGFGIQTFNENIRKQLARVETAEDVQNALNICDEFKLHYDIDIMFGIPGETETDYKLIFQELIGHPCLNRFKIYYLAYYPGTKIINDSLASGHISEQDIKTINTGKIGDWYHTYSLGTQKRAKTYSNYSKLLKIFPIMPKFIQKIITKHKIKYFYLVPSPIIIVLQLTNAIFKGDLRFGIYIKNYIYNFIMVLKKHD